MAKFKVDGVWYDTENFSEHQRMLITSLSVTKDLVTELTGKDLIFRAIKNELEKNLKKNFGSTIKNIVNDNQNPYITLANRKRIEISDIDSKVAKNIEYLSFVNSQLLDYSNQLAVLDTAKITYSKTFYQTIKGAE
jgi:hypothetical protein